MEASRYNSIFKILFHLHTACRHATFTEHELLQSTLDVQSSVSRLHAHVPACLSYSIS